MFKGFSSAACVAVALVVAPAAALAQEELKTYPECGREPSESDITAARAAFQAGNVSFNEADYPRAILYWEDAYRRDCTKHQMLLNLARAYELHGQRKQAVLALETFLLREPSHPDKPQITRRIEVLKKQIDSEEAARASRQPEAPPAASPGPAPADAPAASGAATDGAPAESEGSRPLLPLFVAGAGAALVIAGAVIYFPAASDVDDYADQCGSPDDHDECPAEVLGPANDARDTANLGGVIAGVGGAALVGGVVWYFLSPKQGGSASASAARPRRAVVPAVSRGFAGLAVSGEF